MKTETTTARLSPQKRAAILLKKLEQRYPEPETHLIAMNAWELLVATVLAAQCTDARVNMVTPVLFGKWPAPKDLAKATQEEVETVVRSTGFYRNKAKNIIAAAQRIEEVYGGEVPDTMEDLITLPGVARKTANVVLWGAFKKNEGVAVDTHVSRIIMRLGFTKDRDPIKTEKVMMKLFPQESWGNVNHMLVWFGRHVCDSRNPRCAECELDPICKKQGL